MNPNNHFSNFQPIRKVPYFPNPNLQSFPPPQSQNQTLIIPPNFPPSLLPSLQKYLSIPNSPLYNPTVSGVSLQPRVMQYPSIVSPLRPKPYQTGRIPVGSSALLYPSESSPFLSRISKEGNTFGNYRFNFIPASAQVRNPKNEVKNEKSENPEILSKEKKNPSAAATKNKIPEVEKIRMSEKQNKITSQDSIKINQEKRLEKGYSILNEEQKQEEKMESCLSFADLEKMKIKHQGLDFK